MLRTISAPAATLTAVSMLAIVVASGGCGGRVASDSSATDDAKTATTGGASAGSASGGGSASGSSASTGGSSGSSGTGGGSTAGSTGGGSGSSGGGGTGGGDTGGSVGTAMCADLPLWTLTSVDDAHAALAAPFPNAWQLCAGYTSFFCPKSAPFISFDASGTQASCGNLYEGGFVATSTVSITITEDETGTFFLRWPIPDGFETKILVAYGSASGPHTISLSEHGDPPPPPARMTPAPPLP
jgi:hypothetical protein